MVKFTADDGYSASLPAANLNETRYFFSSSGARGSAVPAIICFNAGGNYLRMFIGQAYAGEINNSYFVKNVTRIDIGGSTGSWASPGISPNPDAAIKKGDPITLTLPAGNEGARIFYTIDGSEPTSSSLMYVEGKPIAAPADTTFTIRAKVIGIGKTDSASVIARYNSSEQDSKLPSKMIIISIDELLGGKLTLKKGDVFFVEVAEGSIKWNSTELTGYYDQELGGYVFTLITELIGALSLTYTDENDVEHEIILEVEEADEEEEETPTEALTTTDQGVETIENDEIPMAGIGDGTTNTVNPWLIAIAAFVLGVGGTIGVVALIFLKKPKVV